MKTFFLTLEVEHKGREYRLTLAPANSDETSWDVIVEPILRKSEALSETARRHLEKSFSFKLESESLHGALLDATTELYTMNMT